MEAKSIQKQKTAAESRGNNRLKFCKRAYKPGSVQSQLRFTSELTKFTPTLPSIWDMRCRMPHATILELTPGKRQGILPCVLSGVAPDRVYMNDRSPGRRRALFSAFPPLHRPSQARPMRYISVALVLRFPSAGVTRYPALRSPDFPHFCSLP